MHLEYEIKFVDMLKFQISYNLFSIPYQAMYLIAPLLLFFTNYTNQDYQHPLWINVTTSVLLYFVEILLVMIFLPLYSFFRRDHTVLTKQILDISELGIHSSNKYLKESYSWNKRIKIAEKLGNVCIYVSKNLVILIPKRVFESQIQRKELIKFVKKMIAKSDL